MEFSGFENWKFDKIVKTFHQQISQESQTCQLSVLTIAYPQEGFFKLHILKEPVLIPQPYPPTFFFKHEDILAPEVES